MAKLKRNIRATAEITLSSMSDIAFLLIIFFLVTSIFLMKEGLHIAMPDRKKPPVYVSPDKILVIEFRKDGQLYLKERKLDMEGIRGELENWHNGKTGEGVLLKISGELPYEKAVTLIDAVKASGETKFSVRMI